MKLIVGLGNLEDKYKQTRHNVGFMVVDRLVGDGEWKESKKMAGVFVKKAGLILVKPSTFMNRSGRAVAAFKSFYKISLSDLYVVHDDLDLRMGEYKVQKGVGPKVHNGIISVEQQLGSKDFWRVRMGVDGRKGPTRTDFDEKPFLGSGADYVLGKFLTEEREVIRRVIGEVVKELAGVLE